MSRVRIARIGGAAGVALAVAAAGLIAPGEASASSRITCSASVSPRHPHQYSTTRVLVHTKAKAAVRTTAHYKTTNTSHSAHAGPNGYASIHYYVARATVGHRVHVSITARGSKHTASCSTWFTPSR